jgi:UDP-N-acetyl-D-galactosamine dehydrogenase
MGFTFKENCADLRNTRVIELVQELRAFGTEVDIYDPHADINEAQHEYNVSLLVALPETCSYDALVVAVAHDEFKQIGIDGIRRLANRQAVIYDIKGMFGHDEVDGRL